MRLGVNIDHVATLREARKDSYPDILEAADAVFLGGGDGITVHLREDRRHIQDLDLFNLRKYFANKHINMEMSVDVTIAKVALKVKPNAICMVPEKRQELTTEGGLEVVKNMQKIIKLTAKMQKKNIRVSLFVSPDRRQIEAANKCGVDAVELHTGAYGEVSDPKRISFDLSLAKQEFNRLIEAALYAQSLKLEVHAGHGLTYENVKDLVRYPNLFKELNIGHNIVARAVFVGLRQAVAEMKALLV